MSCNCGTNLTLPVGPAGPAGASGTAASYSQRFVFVDTTYGNDTTGTKYKPHLPYKTIVAAQTAAASGDTIYVLPGTYSDVGLGKDGVKYYFNLGANITTATTTAIWGDGNAIISYSVDGYGEFKSGGDLMDFRTSSTLKMVCNRLEVTGIGVCIRALSVSASATGANMDVKVNGDIYSPLYLGVRIQTSNNTGITQNIRIEAHNIIADYPVLIFKSGAPTSTMNIYLKAELVKTLGANPSANCLKIYNFDTFDDTNFKATTYVTKCWRSIVNGVGSNKDPVLTGHFTHYGNSQSDDGGPLLGFGRIGGVGSTTPVFDKIVVYGDYIGVGPAIHCGGNSGVKYIVHGDLIANSDGVVNLAAVETSAAIASIIEIHGLIWNKGTGTSSHGWKKYQGSSGAEHECKVMPTCRIVTTNASSLSLTTDASSVVFKVYPGSAANKAASASITQQIATILVDTNVS